MLVPLIGLRVVQRLGRARRRIEDALCPVSARFLLRVAVVAGLLLTVGTSALLAQERVGVNSAVNPRRPGHCPARLRVGW